MKVLFAFLNRVERFMMLYSTLILMGLLCVTVFLRYVMNTDLYAIDEPEIGIAFWMYFMSSAHASNKKRQITADILGFMVKSERAKALLNMLTSLITATVTAIFAYWCISMVIFSIVQDQRTLVWRIPKATYNIAVLAGLALMSLYAFRDIYRSMKDFTSRESIAGEGRS